MSRVAHGSRLEVTWAKWSPVRDFAQRFDDGYSYVLQSRLADANAEVADVEQLHGAELLRLHHLKSEHGILLALERKIVAAEQEPDLVFVVEDLVNFGPEERFYAHTDILEPHSQVLSLMLRPDARVGLPTEDAAVARRTQADPIGGDVGAVEVHLPPQPDPDHPRVTGRNMQDALQVLYNPEAPVDAARLPPSCPKCERVDGVARPGSTLCDHWAQPIRGMPVEDLTGIFQVFALLQVRTTQVIDQLSVELAKRPSIMALRLAHDHGYPEVAKMLEEVLACLRQDQLPLMKDFHLLADPDVAPLFKAYQRICKRRIQLLEALFPAPHIFLKPHFRRAVDRLEKEVKDEQQLLGDATFADEQALKKLGAADTRKAANLKKVFEARRLLSSSTLDASDALRALGELRAMEMTPAVLEKCCIGPVVGSLKSHPNKRVAQTAAEVWCRWLHAVRFPKPAKK